MVTEHRGSMDISGPDGWARLLGTGIALERFWVCSGCHSLHNQQVSMNPGCPGLWLLCFDFAEDLSSAHGLDSPLLATLSWQES